MMFSCADNIFSTPYGNRTLTLDTLSYDHSMITSIKNLNIPADGNGLLQSKAGEYNDLNATFLAKFTNFGTLSALPDSVVATINEANIVFYVADYWGDNANMTLNIDMLGNDTSLYWENISDVNETFSELEGNTTFYSSFTFPTDNDSVYVPIDLDLVNDWYSKKDSFYVNNGFTVSSADPSEGMIAFHTLEYSSTDDDLRPRLRLECTLRDTNDVYLQDSTFFVYCSGDMQKTESNADIADSLFYVSQGNIFRTFIELDSLRADTLLGPTDLLNRAQLSLVIDKTNSELAPQDTLSYKITARLFKTDYWEGDSIQYTYTVSSPLFDETADTISMDISQLLQYLISNPKDKEHEGLFFYMNDEYIDFNILRLDPSKTELDIFYTKVNDE